MNVLTSLFLSPVVATLARGWLVIERGSGRGSGMTLVLCPPEQIRVPCQVPLPTTISTPSKCLCLCYMPTFKKLLILKNVFTGSCKEMYWEGLWTLCPPRPVSASCITVIEYQYLETNIGIMSVSELVQISSSVISNFKKNNPPWKLSFSTWAHFLHTLAWHTDSYFKSLCTSLLWSQRASLALFLTLFLAPCVVLVKLVNLSELWFSHPESDNTNLMESLF